MSRLPAATVIDPSVALRHWLAVAAIGGIALCLLVPATRGYSPVWGWSPLWLVGMPALAWLVLRLAVRSAIGMTGNQPRAVPARRRHRLSQTPFNGRGRVKRMNARHAA